VISGIATGDAEAKNKSFIKVWCQTASNTVIFLSDAMCQIKINKCHISLTLILGFTDFF